MLLLTILLAFSAVQTASAEPSVRIVLLSNAVTRNGMITLSDLLPQSVDDELRTRARSITFGTAPLPGTQRTLNRSLILRALNRSPELSTALEIPASIVITRWCRPLTREEVLKSIEEVLEENHLSLGTPLGISDITFESHVVIAENVPALKVIDIQPIPTVAETRLRIWDSSQLTLPPFWVRISRLIARSTALNVARRLGTSSEARESPAIAPKVADLSAGVSPMPATYAFPNMPSTLQHPRISPPQPALMKVGTAIQLTVQGNGMRISSAATALETGRQGQRIRVQSAPAGKILVATVTGVRTAEIDY